MTETQTGFQLRRREEQIDQEELRERLGAVYAVDSLARAELAVRIGNLVLDEGEACLWAHALTRNDDWILCGPDRAGLRCGVRLGFRERLVSLERLLDDVGHRPGLALGTAYSRDWHDRALGELVLAEDEWNRRGRFGGRSRGVANRHANAIGHLLSSKVSSVHMDCTDQPGLTGRALLTAFRVAPKRRACAVYGLPVTSPRACGNRQSPAISRAVRRRSSGISSSSNQGLFFCQPMVRQLGCGSGM